MQGHVLMLLPNQSSQQPLAGKKRGTQSVIVVGRITGKKESNRKERRGMPHFTCVELFGWTGLALNSTWEPENITRVLCEHGYRWVRYRKQYPGSEESTLDPKSRQFVALLQVRSNGARNHLCSITEKSCPLERNREQSHITSATAPLVTSDL